MGFAVREATVGDAAGIARVRVDSWRSAYGGLIDQAMLAALDAEREAERRRQHWDAHHADPRSRELVAVADADGPGSIAGDVVGWVVTGPNRGTQPGPGWGELYALYAHPSWWGSGVGHSLMLAAERRLREAGFRRALLWVLEGNARAERFYEAHGWREDGGAQEERRGLPSGVEVVLRERRRVRELH